MKQLETTISARLTDNQSAAMVCKGCVCVCRECVCRSCGRLRRPDIPADELEKLFSDAVS